MLLKDIIDIIESVAPLSQQEAWDNSGLQIGHNDADIASVLCCTDVTEAVIDEAIEKGCQLVLTHHPLLFHGLKTIQGRTYQERVAEKAIRHGVAVYSAHTSMDTWLYGVSGRMAEKIGVTTYRILEPSADNPQVGLGVVGTLPQPLTPEQLLKQVKEVFSVSAIRYTQPARTMITTVALGGGACGELMDLAVEKGADVFISAEFKHHQLLQAQGQIMLMDIGHFESEQFTKEIFAELLEGKPVEVHFAEADRSPVMAF